MIKAQTKQLQEGRKWKSEGEKKKETWKEWSVGENHEGRELEIEKEGKFVRMKMQKKRLKKGESGGLEGMKSWD